MAKGRQEGCKLNFDSVHTRQQQVVYVLKAGWRGLESIVHRIDLDVLVVVEMYYFYIYMWVLFL